jgi:CubicO group peptidase (beta-lactamase class C family)
MTIRIPLTTIAWAVLGALAAVVAAPPAQQPDAKVREHIETLVAALSSGSPDTFEAMARQHFAPALLAARSAEERSQMVRRVHEDFGELTVERIEPGTAAEVSARVKGSKGGTLRLRLTFEASAPFRIARLGIEAGGGDDERGGPAPLPPPSINMSMTVDALAGELDKYLADLATRNEFAGVVLVAKDGKPVLEKGYGEADRERHTPTSPDLRFNVASIGKAFTKVAIGQLVQQGTLSLSDPIGTKLPGYPNAQSRAATVDQLLHHTGGIADFFGPRFDATPKDQFQSNADYYGLVSSQPPRFAPGSRNEYCNGCYVVLGEIVARVSGVPYEQYVTEHIFKPAGMTGAGFVGYGDPDVAPGYTRQGSANGTLVSNVAMHGRHGSAAGGAYARAVDLLAFDNAVREGRLLDARMTGWYFEAAPITNGRATGAIGIAGGAPGTNAVLESDGTWTIIVVGNLDPPNAMRVATAIGRGLRG